MRERARWRQLITVPTGTGEGEGGLLVGQAVKVDELKNPPHIEGERLYCRRNYGVDAAVDAAVASLVLCSVADPDAALPELFRVVRPGGDLRVFEHVRAPDPVLAGLQRILDMFWPFIGGGCDTAGILPRPSDAQVSCSISSSAFGSRSSGCRFPPRRTSWGPPRVPRKLCVEEMTATATTEDLSSLTTSRAGITRLT